jgi:N6-adenosine-specific RNA methylase IME4
MMMDIASIKIGKRHRKDLGDIDGLAASMGELGLLHPVVITPDRELIAGERRLRAAESLGWPEISVTVIDLKEVVRGEYAENAYHKPFTLSEAVAIKRALEPLEKAAAKERQREGGRAGGKASGNLPQASFGRAADKAAKATGMARRTLEKAEAVVDAAEAEPEKFGPLLEQMDRTGRANGVYRRLKIARQAEAIRAEPPPFPGNGPYRVGVIDVPWPYEQRTEDPSHRAVRPYPTLSLAQICALPVASIMHTDSILWVWTTNLFMRHAYTALDAWGFEERTILTWAKDRFGNGDWLRGQTEHCILAVRGKPTVTLTNQSTVLHAPTRGHSVKPKEFYDLIESLCPASRYADLFSRYRHNDKWDCHGDEAPSPLIAPHANADDPPAAPSVPKGGGVTVVIDHRKGAPQTNLFGEAAEEKTSGPVINPDGVSIKGCRTIYPPQGPAREYAVLATNPYEGCGHGCDYPCYAGEFFTRLTREQFDAGATLRKDFIANLRKDAAKYQAAGITEQVLISFTSDPYHPGDTRPTREAFEILIEHGLAICPLTKGGMRPVRDLDLFRPERDAFAVTLISLDDAFCRKWEPNAPLPRARISCLKRFHEKGIYTWISIEPVIDAEMPLAVIEATHGFVDGYKIGKIHYNPELERAVDWPTFTLRAVDLLARHNRRAYFKKDLQPFLPPDYPNPMRVPQHHGLRRAAP